MTSVRGSGPGSGVPRSPKGKAAAAAGRRNNRQGSPRRRQSLATPATGTSGGRRRQSVTNSNASPTRRRTLRKSFHNFSGGRGTSAAGPSSDVRKFSAPTKRQVDKAGGAKGGLEPVSTATTPPTKSETTTEVVSINEQPIRASEKKQMVVVESPQLVDKKAENAAEASIGKPQPENVELEQVGGEDIEDQADATLVAEKTEVAELSHITPVDDAETKVSMATEQSVIQPSSVSQPEQQQQKVVAYSKDTATTEESASTSAVAAEGKHQDSTRDAPETLLAGDTNVEATTATREADKGGGQPRKQPSVEIPLVLPSIAAADNAAREEEPQLEAWPQQETVSSISFSSPVSVTTDVGGRRSKSLPTTSWAEDVLCEAYEGWVGQKETQAGTRNTMTHQEITADQRAEKRLAAATKFVPTERSLVAYCEARATCFPLHVFSIAG